MRQEGQAFLSHFYLHYFSKSILNFDARQSNLQKNILIKNNAS